MTGYRTYHPQSPEGMRNPERFEIPTKAGLKAYGQINNGQFYDEPNGPVFNDYYRHIDDVPKELCP